MMITNTIVSVALAAAVQTTNAHLAKHPLAFADNAETNAVWSMERADPGFFIPWSARWDMPDIWLQRVPRNVPRWPRRYEPVPYFGQ